MIATLSRLFRARLALMNGIAALAGVVLHPRPGEAVLAALVFAGVALMAAGASALNQYRERDLDRLMLRTRSRPLPTGELGPGEVAVLGCGFAGGGFVLLLIAGGTLPAFLALAVLLWYLLVYTPLKRRTPFALAVGALCGALAPVIGWSAAGGSPVDFPPVHLAVLLYLWQVPHFWLLQRRHADDYRRAGFPLFDPASRGVNPLPFFLLWMLALICTALMLPAFGLVRHGAALCCAGLCAPLAVALFRRMEPALFAYLNLFPLLLTVALFVGR
ncbi:protoheme IX farnesyltransferase [Geomesophilobacter sediminis]|uniref:Protoheme IX farnesyltransferase n=1 Tax=Geomesophilobacter sediminis TaxID=2798584 RepID=A0A8J7J0L7_9BACT|nr:protoheme IX farnesyltransferase [Geomesophilobacter sediminis]MBJ6726137.1 protoheme IX farnesyltransferase [Geomesophilobacter sediminis]